MKLRTKITLIFGLSFLLLLFVIYSVFIFFLDNNYRAIERQFIEKDFKRVESVLSEAEQTIKTNAEAWSSWDDVYNYVKTQNKNFRQTNVNYETYAAYGMRHVIYTDVSGELIEGYELDDKTKSLIPINKSDLEILVYNKYFKPQLNVGEARLGYISLGNRVLMFGQTPIVNTAKSLPPRGMFLITSEFTDSFISKLSNQTRLDLKILPISTTGFADENKNIIFNNLIKKGNKEILFNYETYDKIRAFAIFKDNFNRDALLVEINANRDIFLQGIQTRNLIMWSILIVGALSLSSIFFILNSTFLERLGSLSEQIKDIADTKKPNVRVKVSGKDELGQLASDVNVMLASLDETLHALVQSKTTAENASMAKTRFLASVSHELRTPIHGIQGLLRMLFKVKMPPSGSGYVQMAYNSSQGLLETINDLLDVSQAEAGKLSINRCEFDIRNVVRDVLQTVGPRVYEKNVLDLICKFNPDIPNLIVCDPHRIRQILINLVANSIKYTPKGKIVLTINGEPLEKDKINLVISCSDTGIGIAPEKMKKIFEPYVQGMADNQGNGLGLNIVKQLTESMGGELFVSSEVNKGTIFTIKLPVNYKTVNKKNYPIEQYPVCCISSEKTFGEAVSLALAPYNIEVQNSSLKEYGKSGFFHSAILLDGKMFADDSGFDLIKKLNAVEKNRIIVLLTPTEVKYRDQLFALGIKEFLLKPFLPDDLYQTICSTNLLLLSSTKETSIASEAKVEGLSNLNILIADDIKTNQIILANLLEDAGHNVKLVGDGQELVEEFTAGNTQFDLILTDIQMPRLDGLSAAKIIRENESQLGKVRIPIIAITAHAFPGEHENMIAMGVDDVITKPVDPAKIRELLKGLFGGKASSCSEIV